MAEDAAVARHPGLMTLGAEHFRERREVALKLRRIPRFSHALFVAEELGVMRFCIENVAGLATFVADKAEMRGVVESRERPALRVRLRGQPVYGRDAMGFFHGVAFHA